MKPPPTPPSSCSNCDQLCSLSYPASDDVTSDDVASSNKSTVCFCGEGYSYNKTFGHCDVEMSEEDVFKCTSSARIINRGEYLSAVFFKNHGGAIIGA